MWLNLLAARTTVSWKFLAPESLTQELAPDSVQSRDFECNGTLNFQFLLLKVFSSYESQLPNKR
jgi:hypothetical protein